jgi:quinolinate synthase
MGNHEINELLAGAAPLIELAIAEDIGPGDATSEATLPADALLQGQIVAKSPGVIAGLPVAEALFRHVEPAPTGQAIQFTAHVADGQEVVRGELVAEVVGPARQVLAAERSALNFLQRMSGIATLTRRFVDAVACTEATILDTRKTPPGYRVLDKYSVRMGGGENHRMSLYDMVLIKDNHIDAAGGIRLAVDRARRAHPTLPVEVEVRDLEELGEALSIEPPLERIMLDNMSLAEMRSAVSLTAGRVSLEASGNVELERAAQIAGTGVDYLSVGALTHSVPALDLSMVVSRPGEAAAQPETGDHPTYSRAMEAKSALGDRVVVLGHHYQRDEVLALADYRGDSLKLARDAADSLSGKADAEFIVFCGVHFMAETAAILAKAGQHVLIPDATAGCYLADTASLEEVEAAWDHLTSVFGDAEAEFTPVTYVNSSAALKAFCGRHGGIVCTSGNAERVLRWALSRRPRVFFFPDQHLGRNTAKLMGIPLEEMRLWDLQASLKDAGDCFADARSDMGKSDSLRDVRVLLWPGACNVHQRFRAEHIVQVRERLPGIQVLVHPECKMEVADLADGVGSTALIIEQVRGAPPGSQWAIGTETRLVHRLQKEHPEQRIIPLADVAPFCRTMSQITLQNLADVLEPLVEGQLVHEVTVDPETARLAKIALERMLAV